MASGARGEMRARVDAETERTDGRKRRGRVLVLVENLSVPFDRRVWQECLALTEVGWEVHVICPTGDHVDREPEAVIDGVHIHRYRLRAAKGGPIGYVSEYATALFQTLRRAWRLTREEPFDVVHGCNPPDLFWLVALVLRHQGTRYVFDHHDLGPELMESRFGGSRPFLLRLTVVMERLNCRVADVVISTNQSYRRKAIERGGCSPDQVHVVRSAPDLDRFQPVEPEPELRRGADHLLCYLGVMGPQDGVDYALRAVAHLRHDLGRHDFHAAFLGAGDAYDSLVALAAELDLGDCVEFVGWADLPTAQRYLSTADVCLAPDPLNPLNDVSSMNKVVEYMAFNRPMVSFDLTETRVSAGEAALYATPNDTGEFAALIAELLDDPELRRTLGALGRQRVETELSWATSREHLYRAYDHFAPAR